MSQQINLILPELLPKHDWLDLRWVLLTAGFFVLLVVGLSWNARREMAVAEATRVSVQQELDGLQKMVAEMNRTILERKPDPALVQEVSRQRESLALRERALHLVDEGKAGSPRGFSELMNGFARQVMEGVWLTGFEFSGKQIEIRGRLREYSLLPAYIRRLNAEEVFRSYRFSALDMKGVEPKDDKAASAPGATKAGMGAPVYTEFVLRSADGGQGAGVDGKEPVR